MIDVHAHYLPANYREALIAGGQAKPDGFPVLPEWSPEAHLEFMDGLGIETALLSVSSPGVGIAPGMARSVNETGAAAVREHPGRFGLLASLPLPDVDAALAELRYALDELHADGVVLLTNYGGTYLGEFEPVLAELNARRAVALLHPTSPGGWERSSLGYPRPVIEFMFDTTRTVADLIMRRRLDGVRIIVPHAGATLAMVADRLAAFQPDGVDVLAALRELYYEVGAGFPFPRQLPALLSLTDADHLLLGTDFPFGAPSTLAPLAERLDALDANARALFEGVRA